MKVKGHERSSGVSRILVAITWRLKRIGIRIEPFLVVREPGDRVARLANGQFLCGFIDQKDVPALVRLQPDLDQDNCINMLGRGVLCYAVKDRGKIIAFMWCDSKEFNFPPNHRLLDEGEVYLFAAYTDPAYRNRNLATYMRTRCYEALRDRGFSRFCSYTNYFNMPARQFKLKVGAINELLRIHIGLFGRIDKTWTVRRYIR